MRSTTDWNGTGSARGEELPGDSLDLDAQGARARLAMLKRAEDGAMAILSPEGVVVSWYARAGDRERADAPVRGRHVEQFYAPVDIAEQLPQRHLETAATRGHSVRFGWRLAASGDRFWSLTDIRPILRHDGTLLGFVHVIRPITGSREPVRTLAPRPVMGRSLARTRAYASMRLAA